MLVSDVRHDLNAEQLALDDIVSGLTSEQFATPTASPGWTVHDQIAHLTYFDGTAVLAITDPDGFLATVEAVLSAVEEGDDGDDYTLAEYRTYSPAALLSAWRANRSALDEAAATLGEDTRVVWYGPSMGAKSFLTARLMEVWAHGQDVCDAIGATRTPTDRLRHIAQLGFITRGWTYVNRGLEVPDAAVRVELTSPSGDVWGFGPDDASQSVSGPAEDFCLVVTQRRHVDDTRLSVVGDDARDWMEKAQAFAGRATDGPGAS